MSAATDRKPLDPTTRFANAPNSSPQLARDTVDVMARYQELGKDLELLRTYLRAPMRLPYGAARIAAVQLAAAALTQGLNKMLITMLSEAGE